MIIRWPHHHRRPGCTIADGCDRCGAESVFELTTHCAGRVLEPIERSAIRGGHLDYENLSWMAASELAQMTAEEIRSQEWYKP